MSDDDRFLSRWSQRKRLAAEEARKAAEAAPAPAEPPAEEEPFDLSLLPDLESLTPETDISLFLKKGVPDELRNTALRKMWALDPAIRDYVGDALDYAWDWNAPGGVPGGGELGAGFDTAKMVAQIFGDDASDKNVIDPVSVQQNAPEVLAASADVPAEAAPEAGKETEVAAGSCTSLQVASEMQNRGVPAALHKKRRHGGAAPA
ncbi:MAG: hypothetical protein JWO64_359 [Hyphomicrobiales bacterium]|nr:hypothetical protein [Hyphomicrobiales bacterium]